MRGAPLLVFIEWAVCLVLCLIVPWKFRVCGLEMADGVETKKLPVWRQVAIMLHGSFFFREPVVLSSS